MYCPYCGNCKKFINSTCSPNEFCQRKFRLDTLFDQALVTHTQRIPIILYRDKLDDEAYTHLESAASNIEMFVNNGYNIYIYSTTTGNGKTSWAVKLIRAYFYAIWHKTDLSCKALFISVPKYLLALKDNITKKSDYVEHIKENMLDADIVVWDDIGSKCGTEFEIEHLLSNINARLDNGKCNIYTSNLTPEDLVDAVGPRLASRVCGMSQHIEFRENDKRGLTND